MFWLLCWIHLLQIVKGLGSYQTASVYPKYKLRTLSPRSKILGIWKIKTKHNQELAIRTFTEAKLNYIKTNCHPVKLNILLNLESPALPSSLRLNEKNSITEEYPFWFNQTIQLDELDVSTNSTNEQRINIPFQYSSNRTYNQFLTCWYEDIYPAEDLPLKSRIENKFGMSTSCTPQIQFNLTDMVDADTNDPAADEPDADVDLSEYEFLPKVTFREHQLMFYTNETANTTLSEPCNGDFKHNFYIDIDAEAETGGVLEFKLLGANGSVCLSQRNADCDLYGLKNNQSLYLPQPKSGTWLIDLSNVTCIDEELKFNLTMNGCVDSCGEYDGRGECMTYYTEGNVIMSTCNCKAGYSGYGCSNDDNAMSIQFQLVQMMLLTMSNLFFLPAIFIGFYRRYWQETTVYIIAMATSTLYHACDQFGTQKYYCIAPYDTLQFADFLAATVAIWVTVLAIADLPSRWTSLLHSVGILCFAIGAHHNRFSVWLFASPVVIGFLILISHWIYQCRIRRDCYPHSRTWLCHLIPGLTLAMAGFMTKIFFEFEDEGASNYYWTHTLWHALLGLACAFLLPEVAYDSAKLYNSNSNNLISYYKSFDEPNFEPNAL